MFGPLRTIERATGPIDGGYSKESGFESGTFRHRSQDLTTRPPTEVKTLSLGHRGPPTADFEAIKQSDYYNAITSCAEVKSKTVFEDGETAGISVLYSKGQWAQLMYPRCHIIKCNSACHLTSNCTFLMLCYGRTFVSSFKMRNEFKN
ncbi:hypothetical protein AVEN_238850-1 [Araneus ventricosus]|uniref:Uncharacterized protein n=1 Tax=Araneus ventricosus TaxID=182803 RepID=A0A4Y2ENM8_ARAVE|nr:hypothetical protein AVEN_238850-1 [Araneus ventricosus]